MNKKIITIAAAIALLSSGAISSFPAINNTNITANASQTEYSSSIALANTISFTGKYQQSSARQMLDKINQLRTGSEAWAYNANNEKESYKNLSKLTYDYDLEKVAMQRAAELVASYSHTRPNGTKCFTAYHGTFVNGSKAENIAIGTSIDMNKAFQLWEEKDKQYSGQGHRRNMLKSDFVSVGIAHFYYNGCHYWVQEFSSETSGADKTIANNSNTTVNIKINPQKATDKKLLINCDDNVKAKKAYKLPEIQCSFRYKNMWKNGPAIKTTIKTNWKVSKGKNIVKIKNGKFVFSEPGDATFTTMYNNNPISINIKVLSDPIVVSQTKPRKTSITLGTAKKKLVVKISKRSEASKYQIQYSTNSKFKGAKTVNTKLTRKVLSAKSKKKYYVRARVIKTIGGKNYVGSWSTVKTIKVK